MRVKLSERAAHYVRKEGAYLRQYSPRAAGEFVDVVRSVRRDLSSYADAGFITESAPVPEVRRLIRAGYRFDYVVYESTTEIIAITSSVNTPLAGPSDDPDYDYEG